MKTPFTLEQNTEYAVNMIKVWNKEVKDTLAYMQKIEPQSSLAQTKLKRVAREMTEVSELINKK